MSDHYLCFIPIDARFVPSDASQHAAAALLRATWPDAREITPETDDHILFIDCGENFDRVLCPHCRTELDVGLWQDLMIGDYSELGGFRLDRFSMPCCGKQSTLNELEYEWPQGFCRFVLTATDPGGEVPENLLARLESTLGCKLRVIRQMC